MSQSLTTGFFHLFLSLILGLGVFERIASIPHFSNKSDSDIIGEDEIYRNQDNRLVQTRSQ
jgi:hypothetical protein